MYSRVYLTDQLAVLLCRARPAVSRIGPSGRAREAGMGAQLPVRLEHHRPPPVPVSAVARIRIVVLVFIFFGVHASMLPTPDCDEEIVAIGIRSEHEALVDLGDQLLQVVLVEVRRHAQSRVYDPRVREVDIYAPDRVAALLDRVCL